MTVDTSGILPVLPTGWTLQMDNLSQYNVARALYYGMIVATGTRPYIANVIEYASGSVNTYSLLPIGIIDEMASSGFVVTSSYLTSTTGDLYNMWQYSMAGTGIAGFYA